MPDLLPQTTNLSDAPVTPPVETVPQPVQEMMPVVQNVPTQVAQTAPINVPQVQQIPIDTSRVMYWNETQNVIRELEQRLQMKIFSFYIPLDASLTTSDVQNFYYHLERTGKQEKVGIVLFGPGGNGIAAYRLIKLIRNYAKQVVCLVPDLAASAMTMFSLGADVIMTGPLTTFSAIDSSLANHPLAPKDSAGYPVSVEITQIGKFLEMVSADSYKSDDFTKSAYNALSEKVHPLLLGAIQRSFTLSKKLTASILRTHFTDEEKINKIVDALNDEYPTHSYPVLPEDLAQYGIATMQMPQEINRLCTDILDFYMVLGEGGSKVEGNKKSKWKRQAFIESVDLRTWYYTESEYKLTDKGEWIRVNSTGEYLHAGKMKSAQGFYKVATFSTTQFKEYMNGKEVVERA